MEALKQGNGFTPKTEDTPAEAASDITFVSIRTLWPRPTPTSPPPSPIFPLL